MDMVELVELVGIVTMVVVGQVELVLDIPSTINYWIQILQR